MNRRHAVFAMLFAAFVPGYAHADARNVVMAGIAQCAAVVDNRAWLDCVYGAAQPMRALLGLPPAPQYHGPSGPVVAEAFASALPSARVAAQSPQDFRLRAPSTPTVGKYTRMVLYKFDGEHHFMVVLADGQVWSQLSGDTSEAGWSKPASTYMVNISPGFLGSYNLKVAGELGSFKVTRVATAKS